MCHDELSFIALNVAQYWIVSYPKATLSLNVFFFDYYFFGLQFFNLLDQHRFIDVFFMSVVNAMYLSSFT